MRLPRTATLTAVAAIGLALCAPAAARGATDSGPAGASASSPVRVLVFSRTTTFRHPSIPFGIAAIRELGPEYGFKVVTTEDPKAFRRRNLRRFSAVVFLLTTGDVLNRRQQRAFRRYVRRGGGFAGIHSASDTEHDWPWYGRLVGAWFKNHPIQQTGTFVNEAPRHRMTRHLARRFTVFDEFYSFDRNPRADVRVLLSIDEDTYMPDPNTSHLPGGEPSTGYMGDHPMAWCHNRLAGRVFYTALGHEPYLYQVEWFRRHMVAGILYAARQVRADCRPRPLP